MLISEFAPEIEVVGQADGVSTGTQTINKLNPDVVFLDIRMPSGSEGFDLLASLPEKNFQVVFVTAFKDYAIKALNAKALHYMLKPIDIDDLKAATEKLIDYSKSFDEDSAVVVRGHVRVEAPDAALDAHQGHLGELDVGPAQRLEGAIDGHHQLLRDLALERDLEEPAAGGQLAVLDNEVRHCQGGGKTVE